MSQIIGIAAFVACIAVLVLLPGREWPRAPGWMRTTAVVSALVLLGVAAVAASVVKDAQGGAGGLVLLAFAFGAGMAGLWLLGWAWVGRLKPRSIIARLFAEPPAKPRTPRTPRR